MEDIYVQLINKYISFYKKEIRKCHIFDEIDFSNLSSTNNQMELFNEEIEKFKKENETYRDIFNFDPQKKKKYVLKKNAQNYLMSDSLISIIIENINLENEEKNSVFELKLFNSKEM
jgi:hypothetical protein